jgi:D-glycero-D-manno-heptose 1,7-bisphosphate phosphatase
MQIQSQKFPALFLDRDGVINRDKNYTHLKSDFEFNPEIFHLIKLFKSHNFKVIVVTNQSGIGRNIFSLAIYHEITDWMLKKLAEQQCEIDLIITSTLNPELINPSKHESYRRKPNPGMIYDANEILDLDLKNSILIGDKESDIIAGKTAGISKLVLIGEKSDIKGVTMVKNLAELTAVSHFLLRLHNVKT